MTITICHNKPPDRKWGLSEDDVMPGRDGPENLRILKRCQLIARYAAYWVGVSIGFEELCLSPHVTMERSQKLINPFVSETTKSACICVSICICIYIIITDITKLCNQRRENHIHYMFIFTFFVLFFNSFFLHAVLLNMNNF